MSAFNQASIPAKLEMAMREAGFSKLDMALALKVHPSMITKWLKPESNMTLNSLKRFCDALGLEITLTKS